MSRNRNDSTINEKKWGVEASVTVVLVDIKGVVAVEMKGGMGSC